MNKTNITNIQQNKKRASKPSAGYKIKILIACEESQTVCKAFRKLGFRAYSCDIQEQSGGHPEWHIQGDAIKEAYSGKYDMMIAHPPCTYLSNAGAAYLWRGHKLNEARFKKGLDAKDFFLKLLNAPIRYICVENPIPSRIYDLPKKNQMIEPYFFGDIYKKKTYLWLKGLPKLMHVKEVNLFDNIKTHVEPKFCWVNGTYKNDRQLKGIHCNPKMRSKTFDGIAQAMAKQWGDFLINEFSSLDKNLLDSNSTAQWIHIS
jgi:hypothetical protein